MDKERLMESRRRVYRHQAKVLESHFEAIPDIGDLRRFFFGLLYLPPDEEKKFQERNREFIRVSGSKLLRLLAGQYVVGVLRQVIELQDLTRELDTRMAACLADKPGWLKTPDGDPALYRQACRNVVARDERERQLHCALEGFDLVAAVVRYAPFDLATIIRLTPKAFIRNEDLLDLSVNAYNVFRRNKNRLAELRALLKRTETQYINELYS